MDEIHFERIPEQVYVLLATYRRPSEPPSRNFVLVDWGEKADELWICVEHDAMRARQTLDLLKMIFKGMDGMRMIRPDGVVPAPTEIFLPLAMRLDGIAGYVHDLVPTGPWGGDGKFIYWENIRRNGEPQQG